MAQACQATAAARVPPARSTRRHGSSSSAVLGTPLAMQPRTQQRQRRVCAVQGAAAPTTDSAHLRPSQPPPPPGERFDRADWNAWMATYSSCHTERSGWIEEGAVEGRIPPELRGSLLRNGPGLFEVGGTKIPQPFDGDGLLALLAIRDGRAFFANRFVRTQGFLAEQAAGRLLHRGAFSVGNPAGRGPFANPFSLDIKGTANTGVLHWGGKVLALYERDLPYEVAPPDLRTRGQTVPAPSPAPFLAAHYRVMEEPGRGRRLLAFNSDVVRGTDNRLGVFEYDEGLRQLSSVEVDLPGAGFAFFHDFAATPHYYVFVENPMRLDLWRLATGYLPGRACMAECIKYAADRRPTKVHLIPRPGTRGAAAGRGACLTFETPAPFFSWHHVNAYEVEGAGGAGGTTVVLDTVALLEGVDLGANMDVGAAYYEQEQGRGTLTRLVIDVEAGRVAQHRLLDRACEFPSVAPARVGRPHTHAYMVASRFPGAEAWGAPQVLAKVSLPPTAGVSAAAAPTAPAAGAAAAAAAAGGVGPHLQASEDCYYPGRSCFVGEPIFVPRPGGQAEDDGWVLALVYDAARGGATRLEILDARRLSAGPLAVVHLPVALPSGLHGSWTGEFLGPAPGQDWPTREHDIRAGVTAD